MFYALKVVLSAMIIVGVTELSKRVAPLWAGVLASLPLISLLSFIWLYAETRDSAKVAALSWNVFWLVLPSLSFFAALPWLLKKQWSFASAMAVSVLVMIGCYLVTAIVIRKFGVSI